MVSRKFFTLSAVLMTIFLLSSGSADAARLYFDVPDEVPFEETFFATLRIDEEGECVNAVDVTLTYPVDVLTAVQFSRGDSLLSLWPEPPVVDTTVGEVSFAGGIPGGFCGTISGDTGDANALGVLVLRALSNPGDIATTRRATIGFREDAQVLLSDGFGTPAELTTESATVTVRELGQLPEDQWQALLDADTIPPEAFTVILQRSPLVFGGAPYVTFSTTDKQSGIDYYEVREAVRGEESSMWVRWEAGKPYPLTDADAGSIVTVRAYDKAGNVREAQYIPQEQSEELILGRTKLEAILLGGIGIAIAVLIGALAWAVRRRGMENKDGTPNIT